jgi:hypothetical protein
MGEAREMRFGRGFVWDMLALFQRWGHSLGGGEIMGWGERRAPWEERRRKSGGGTRG